MKKHSIFRSFTRATNKGKLRWKAETDDGSRLSANKGQYKITLARSKSGAITAELSDAVKKKIANEKPTRHNSREESELHQLFGAAIKSTL